MGMMGKMLSSGHWVPLMMGIKPLVALLRRQCNAHRRVRPFHVEHLFAHVATAHRIHSMTHGTKGTILGALREAILAEVASIPLTIPSTHPAVGSNSTLRGQQAILLSQLDHPEISLTVVPLRCRRRQSTLTLTS